MWRACALASAVLLALPAFAGSPPQDSAEPAKDAEVENAIRILGKRADESPGERLAAAALLLQRSRGDLASDAIHELSNASDPTIAACCRALNALSSREGSIPSLDSILETARGLDDTTRRAFLFTVYDRVGRFAIRVRDERVTDRCIDELRKLASESKDPRIAIDADLVAGADALSRFDSIHAAPLLQSAFTSARAAGDALLEARARAGLGWHYSRIDDTEHAIVELRAACATFSALHATEVEQEFRIVLGQQLMSHGDVDAALVETGRGIALARQLADTSAEVFALKTEGLILLATGHPAESAERFSAMREIGEKLHRPAIRAEAERDLAVIEFSQDHLETARRLLEHSLSSSLESGDVSGSVEARFRIASIADRQGDTRAVIEHATAVLDDELARREAQYALDLLLMRGAAHHAVGDYPAARRDIESGLAIARERAQKTMICYGLFLRSKVAASTGDLDAALADAIECVAASIGTPDPSQEIEARLFLAEIRLVRRESEEAAKEFAAITVPDDASPLVRCYVEMLRSRILDATNDPVGAKAAAETALATAEDTGDRAIVQFEQIKLAEAALERVESGAGSEADLADAKRYATAALGDGHDPTTFDRRQLDATFVLIGCALREGNVEDAATRIEHASRAVERVAGSAAIEQMGVESASRARAPFSELSNDVMDLVAIQVARADDSEKRKLIERGFARSSGFQARALLEGIEEHRAGGRDKRILELRSKRKEALDRREAALRLASERLLLSDAEGAAAARAESNAAFEAAGRIDDELATADPRHARAFDPPSIPPQELVRAGIVGPGRAVLQYVMGRTHTFVYVVAPGETRLVDLGNTADLESEIAAYLTRVADPKRLGTAPEIATLGGKLFDDLLRPAFPDPMKAESEWIVVPSGAIASLPFESLVVDVSGPKGDATFDRIEFVLDRFSVRYAPSIPVLLELQEEGRRTDSRSLREKRALVIASPEIGGDLPPLPAAAEEGKIVASHFDSVESLVGKSALASILRGDLRRFDVLHFATHGAVSATTPLETGLVLRGVDGKAELVGVPEVLDFDLSAQLVVLSACSTSEGPRREGEGVESLARAFLFAGSRSVVASLWELSDAAALPTIRVFYDEYSKNATPSQALLLAKRALRHGALSTSAAENRGVGSVRRAPITAPSGHPFLWAPLVAIGK